MFAAKLGRLAMLASLVIAPACRISLEDPAAATDSSVDAMPSASCMEATMHSDLTFIEDKIFRQSCIFSGCHNGSTSDEAGAIDLRPPGVGNPPAPGTGGRSAEFLVDVDSKIDPAHKLVVAGQPEQSYLLMMLKHIPPAEMDPPTTDPPMEVGFMPQNAGGGALCVQKRDAIQRWIEAGAPAL